ncbi:MAG: hypothetical protein AAF219_10805 [Myxococcota bacterium]
MDDVVVTAARRFVETFIKAGKRDSYLKLLARQRTYSSFVEQLDHLRWLDNRLAAPVLRHQQHTWQIEELLRNNGAPETCVVVSADPRDCGSMSLRQALTSVVGGGYGAIVSCIEGELAYYEAEEPFSRFLCRVNHARDLHRT